MKIRAYRADDWESVREIYDLGKPDEMQGLVPVDSILPLNAHPEMLKLFRESDIIVAEEEERVVGFSGNRGTNISWLFVHPAYRRKGIASALVRRIIAKIEGKVTLNVAKSNVSARKLYEGLGFTIEREFEGKFNGHPCAAMRLSYVRAG